MKANTKFNLGIFICYFGSIIIIALIGLAGLPAGIANMIYAVLGGIGIFILRAAYNAGVQIVQGREYTLIGIHRVKTDIAKKNDDVFTTFSYKNAYGNEVVHTFKNLEFKQGVSGYVGEKFVGYIERDSSKKLVMTKI